MTHPGKREWRSDFKLWMSRRRQRGRESCGCQLHCIRFASSLAVPHPPHTSCFTSTPPSPLPLQPHRRLLKSGVSSHCAVLRVRGTLLCAGTDAGMRLCGAGRDVRSGPDLRAQAPVPRHVLGSVVSAIGVQDRCGGRWSAWGEVGRGGEGVAVRRSVLRSSEARADSVGGVCVRLGTARASAHGWRTLAQSVEHRLGASRIEAAESWVVHSSWAWRQRDMARQVCGLVRER
jgi:hypothetical protein